MGSVRELDLATWHGVRSHTRIFSRCSASNCLASRTSPACLIFRHSRDPRKCCLPAFRAYLLTAPLLLVFAAWFPFVAHMVVRDASRCGLCPVLPPSVPMPIPLVSCALAPLDDDGECASLS